MQEKLQKTQCIVVLGLLLLLPAAYAIPSPPAIPHVIRGTVTVDGVKMTRADTSVIVTAKVNGNEVANYKMGTMNLDEYFLYIELNSTVKSGMQAQLFVNGRSINENPVVIGDSGTEHILDISVGSGAKTESRNQVTGDSKPFTSAQNQASGSSSAPASSQASSQPAASQDAAQTTSQQTTQDAQDQSAGKDAAKMAAADSSGSSELGTGQGFVERLTSTRTLSLRDAASVLVIALAVAIVAGYYIGRRKKIRDEYEI